MLMQSTFAENEREFWRRMICHCSVLSFSRVKAFSSCFVGRKPFSCSSRQVEKHSSWCKMFCCTNYWKWICRKSSILFSFSTKNEITVEIKLFMKLHHKHALKNGDFQEKTKIKRVLLNYIKHDVLHWTNTGSFCFLHWIFKLRSRMIINWLFRAQLPK